VIIFASFFTTCKVKKKNMFGPTVLEPKEYHIFGQWCFVVRFKAQANLTPIDPASSKNDTYFKGGLNRLENYHLASLILISDTISSKHINFHEHSMLLSAFIENRKIQLMLQFEHKQRKCLVSEFVLKYNIKTLGNVFT